jgi:CheY-like chemotaxis protein
MADILIIDDDAQMRRLVGRVLKPLGHVVHEAANGKEGLALFRKLRPALVVSDIVMPDTEGIETIRALRQEDATIPILAISGGSAPSLYLRAATNLGASASLEKPFDLERLRVVVAELLAATPNDENKAPPAAPKT